MGAAVSAGSGWQVTTTLLDYLPEMFFRLVDTRGSFESGSKSAYNKFLDILLGKLQPGDRFDRFDREYDIDVPRIGDKEYQCPVFGDRIHGVIFVVRGNDHRLKNGYYKESWKSFRDLLGKLGKY